MKYKCKKGEKQHKVCKEYDMDICSDCPHGAKENSIEEDRNNIIEELTKVRTDKLSKEGLKLFNKINEIIDENERLEEENRIYGLEGCRVRLKLYIDKNYISKSLVKAKIEELKNLLKTCNKKTDIDRIKAINERILELQELLREE